MDFRNEVSDAAQYGVEIHLELYIYYHLFDDGVVQLRERTYRAKPLYIWDATPESFRPYGPLWEHHLPLYVPLEIQHLILGFLFHSEESMQTAVNNNFETLWGATWDFDPVEFEEPVGLFLEE